MNDPIVPPPLTHPNIAAKMRAAPPLGEFDEAAALARMQRITFLRTLHANRDASQIDPALRAEWQAHQARVATYAVVRAPKPPATLAPLPAATAPRSRDSRSG